MTTKITKAKAEQVLAAIKKQFAGYDTNEAFLRWDDDADCWEIMWECGSPYEWALSVFEEGGVDVEATNEMRSEFPDRLAVVRYATVQCPKGVYVEANYSFSLHLYPDN